MIIAGLGAGAMAGLRFRRSAAPVALIATAAATSGLLFTGILNWLGVLNGRYWPVSAAITLAAGASAAFVAGMIALLGTAGLGAAAFVTMIVGNPLAGVATSPKLIPTPWGAVGQWLPPGASGTLLRDTAYFPEAPIWRPVVILCLWTIVGAAGLAIGHRNAFTEFAGR